MGMCYTGKGDFENSMGDCKVRDFKTFKKEMGIEACVVCGGYPFDRKEAEKENVELFSVEELKEKSKEAVEKKLIR